MLTIDYLATLCVRFQRRVVWRPEARLRFIRYLFSVATLGVEFPALYGVPRLVFALFGMCQHRDALRRVNSVVFYGVQRLDFAMPIVQTLDFSFPTLCHMAFRGSSSLHSETCVGVVSYGTPRLDFGLFGI
jgi:hypothetical protein